MAGEPPTRRIDPVPPTQHGVVEREVYTDDAAWRQEIVDRLGSLRTAVALLGVLAAAAFGVGLYALLSDEDTSEGDGRRGASPARVADLEERVDRLESQVEGRATDGDLDEVRQDVADLEGQVEEASQAATQDQDGGDTAELQRAIEDQTAAIEDLQGRVEQLEQQQAAGGGTETP